MYRILALTLAVATITASPIFPDGIYDLMKDADVGDIMLTSEQKDGISKMVGVVNEGLRWPNRIVPYTIGSEYTTQQRNFIISAMRTVETQVCIRFVPRTTERDFVNIRSGNGCSSFVGRIGGSQQMSLWIGGGINAHSCLHTGVIIHEILHALGLWHMHQYEGRYSHVVINWQNIQTGMEHAFNRVARASAHNFGTAYDYRSIMHYEPRAFSRNGLNTITTRNPAFQNVIGQLQGMSAGDISRVRSMYRC